MKNLKNKCEICFTICNFYVNLCASPDTNYMKTTTSTNRAIKTTSICAATIEELQELTQSEKTTAWNLYGDWKMENLLGIAPKCTGLAKLAIDYVISKRKKIA